MPEEDVRKEMTKVIEALQRERSLEQELAAGRADTGEALFRLEVACREVGLKREAWIVMLREKAAALDLAELTMATVRDRTRMASFRKCHSAETTGQCLRLGPSKLRLIATLPDARLEEFVHQGVPVAKQRTSPWSQAKGRDLRRAVRASRGLPPWEPIPEELLTPSEKRMPSAFDRVMKQVRQLGSLTMEQSQEFLMMLVTLFALTSETRRTTRRMRENAIEMNSREAGTETVDQELRSLDAGWRMVEFGPGVDRFEATSRACAIMARLLLTVSRWTRPEREAG